MSGAFLYSVTASCLTPITDMAAIHISSGVASMLIRADSDRDAIRQAIKEIGASYEADKELTAIPNYLAHTLSVMDDNGHIVNHFWSFRVHRV